MSDVSVPDYSNYDLARIPLNALVARKFGPFNARIAAILLANRVGVPTDGKVMVVSCVMLTDWVNKTHALGELNRIYQGVVHRNGAAEVIHRGLDVLVQLGHLVSSEVKGDTYYAMQQSFYDALMADVR